MSGDECLKALYNQSVISQTKGWLPFDSELIPPALWATGGLAVVNGKLPLSLPSPRASDPACLEVARVYIAFAKVYELPSEGLQKRRANLRVTLVFLFFLTAVGRFVAFTENDKTTISFFFNFFNYASCRASAAMKQDRS